MAFWYQTWASRDKFREVLSRLDAIENSLDHLKEEQGRQRAWMI